MYLLLLLRTGPHLKKIHGMGIIAIFTKPNSEIAQWKPRLWTICTVNRGNEEDIMKRMNVVAANTEAP